MIGSRLGPYEIRAEVGRGGMAVVYRAYQPSVDREVAIKVIHTARESDAALRERFRREARLIARLEHPGVLPIYDFHGAHDPPYIVMRYLEGGTLRDLLAARRLTHDAALALLGQVAAALDYAHAQGVVHRDIKPSNILLDRHGNALVSDFGIARIIGGVGGQITGTGAIIGTPDYMAPEQALGRTDVDGRADVYALGVLVFQLLTGRLPYTAEQPMGVVVQHLQAPVPSALALSPALPPAIDELLRRALAKDPAARLPTAGALVGELAALLAADPGARAARTSVLEARAVNTTPTSQSAGLARQLRDPLVRDELAEFRAIFNAARSQIGLLNRYKALHDTLQELERPFNIVSRDRRRLADDPAAWDDLYPQIADIQDFARAAMVIMADPHMADESAWATQQLQMAVADLDSAQSQADVRRLDLAVGRCKRVLARELPRADSRLAACAGDLRLAQVTQALGAVQAALHDGAPELGALRTLATWITTLDGLNAQLEELVPSHRRWQAVDSELRRVAESLGGDPTELELAWGDLLLQTAPLFGGATEGWAAALNALSVQIDQALADGAIPQARRHFISYQSRATRRFMDVDKLLLATCNELRGAGDTLDLILRTLDE